MNSLFRHGWIALLALLPVLGNAADTNVVAAHAQDLVALQGDALVPFSAAPLLKAPRTILYFGAGWCPDCRRFSPTLVDAYNQQPKDARRFEVLFVSMDKSAAEMQRFMALEKMPWPAVTFDKANADDLRKFYSGHGIPCLTVIDAKGTVLLQSKSDQDAAEILKQLK